MLSLFRSELTVQKFDQQIMDEVNRQLIAKEVIIQGTAVVDAKHQSKALFP
ncbi:MAG: hypothetical protein OXC67_00820 [Flavobacteriaceae bacterium]|nr:hypothetical protein [Flavobacteriaceae bacterium]